MVTYGVGQPAALRHVTWKETAGSFGWFMWGHTIPCLTPTATKGGRVGHIGQRSIVDFYCEKLMISFSEKGWNARSLKGHVIWGQTWPDATCKQFFQEKLWTPKNDTHVMCVVLVHGNEVILWSWFIHGIRVILETHERFSFLHAKRWPVQLLRKAADLSWLNYKRALLFEPLDLNPMVDGEPLRTKKKFVIPIAVWEYFWDAWRSVLTY